MKVLDILFIVVEIEEIKENRDISNKGKEKKKMLLRKVMVKIRLKQED